MAIEHYLLIDTDAGPDAVKAAILAATGLEDQPDWKHLRQAGSAATLLTIRDRYDPKGPEDVRPNLEPRNGVPARISVCFRSRDYERLPQFDTEAVTGVVAVLKAFPEADLYLNAYVDIPGLLRKDGRLVLASRLTEDGLWAPSRPFLALVDVPYTIEPLGPWYPGE